MKMNKELSKRTAIFDSEFKTRAVEDKKIIEGYFVVYNERTELWPGVYEEISDKALLSSLETNDIRCLFNHDSNIVLGRTGNNTLTLTSDDYGLKGAVEINENDREDNQALDIYHRIERGDISSCSFGFFPTKETRHDEEDGSVRYVVEEGNIIEVSPVAFPAYPTTQIEARKSQLEKSNEAFERRKKALLTKLKGE